MIRTTAKKTTLGLRDKFSERIYGRTDNHLPEVRKCCENISKYDRARCKREVDRLKKAYGYSIAKIGEQNR